MFVNVGHRSFTAAAAVALLSLSLLGKPAAAFPPNGVINRGMPNFTVSSPGPGNPHIRPGLVLFSGQVTQSFQHYGLGDFIDITVNIGYQDPSLANWPVNPYGQYPVAYGSLHHNFPAYQTENWTLQGRVAGYGRMSAPGNLHQYYTILEEDLMVDAAYNLPGGYTRWWGQYLNPFVMDAAARTGAVADDDTNWWPSYENPEDCPPASDSFGGFDSALSVAGDDSLDGVNPDDYDKFLKREGQYADPNNPDPSYGCIFDDHSYTDDGGSDS